MDYICVSKGDIAGRDAKCKQDENGKRSKSNQDRNWQPLNH